jgi:hypothetical protein
MAVCDANKFLPLILRLFKLMLFDFDSFCVRVVEKQTQKRKAPPQTNPISVTHLPYDIICNSKPPFFIYI